MSSKLMIPTQRVFYGWFVVAAAFAVTFVGFGSAYTFSTFVDRCRGISPPRAVRYRWCSRSPGFCTSASGSSAVRSPTAGALGVLAVAGMLLTGVGPARRQRGAHSDGGLCWPMGSALDSAWAAPMSPRWARCSAGSSSAAASPPVSR